MVVNKALDEKILNFCCNIFTLINWFSISILYYYPQSDFKEILVKRPIKYSSLLFLCGISSTSLGVLIAGLRPWSSYIIANVLGIYINFRLFKRIAC
ncbi:putative ORFan [Tupanvirus deep ocean]|uniref:ORFan n=2 Tax=Tupanvirus TaxID=2094720 RepID=A0AC62A777_9VIRU|nr:putative ORFan [Tupanvirus deep ocean]QKU33453.1 putative ORFan [Tupanvirus deep ocean]